MLLLGGGKEKERRGGKGAAKRLLGSGLRFSSQSTREGEESTTRAVAMGSVGVLTAAADQKLTVAETEEEEVEQGREIHAVLDFDMLCATVALQTQGFSAGRTRWKESAAEEAEEEGLKFGGVQRMWEGDVMDCFDDRRIAIEAAWLALVLQFSTR